MARMEKSRKTGVKQSADKYIVRFPDGMRERISEAAKANSRSMNAEIVARLQASFEPDNSNLATAVITKLLDAQYERLMASVQEVVAAAKAPPSTTEN